MNEISQFRQVANHQKRMLGAAFNQMRTGRRKDRSDIQELQINIDAVNQLNLAKNSIFDKDNKSLEVPELKGVLKQLQLLIQESRKKLARSMELILASINSDGLTEFREVLPLIQTGVEVAKGLTININQTTDSFYRAANPGGNNRSQDAQQA